MPLVEILQSSLQTEYIFFPIQPLLFSHRVSECRAVLYDPLYFSETISPSLCSVLCLALLCLALLCSVFYSVLRFSLPDQPKAVNW